MQKWPRELPGWLPWRIQTIWMMLLLLLPSGHNNRIHVCRWWSSFHNPVTCTAAKTILCYCERLRAQGNATEPSQQLSQRVRESRVQQLLLLLRLFLPLASPPESVDETICLSIRVLLLCFFFVLLLPHWENASRLLNYRNQVACQQQKWSNTPLKIHLAVLTMNIIKAASSGPPKRERTEQLSHTCFWTTGCSVQPFVYLSCISPFCCGVLY